MRLNLQDISQRPLTVLEQLDLKLFVRETSY